MRSLDYYIQGIERKIDTRRAEKKDARFECPILVFESDDWGSIRVPSSNAIMELTAKGYKFAEKIGYDRYDTLASNEDMEILIETLSSVKDSKGNPAKLTMNCVVANPDFEKIKNSEYTEYHYELFPDTLMRYPHHDRSFELWKEGIKLRVLRPQFHGREHLNVQMWLALLKKGCRPVVDSFQKRVFSVVVDPFVDKRQHCLAAYNIATEEEYGFAKQSIEDGLNLFEHLFGYRSESMIAPNYTWDTVIEDIAASNGVKYIQGVRRQRHSEFVLRNGGKPEVRFVGERNKNSQIYLVRNCSFEPSEYASINADFCMAQIKKAFDSRLSAIVSVHRQNFIGELCPANRDNNIKQFKGLLKTIVTKYPDVVFLSSDEFGQLLETQSNELK